MKLKKQWITLSFWICTFLFVPYSGKAQLALADSLFQNGNFLEARVEYERLIFLQTKDASRNELLLKKSFCYKAEGKFDKAFETLKRTDYYSGEDSIRVQLFYESILNAYLSEQYDIALSLLSEMKYNFENIENYNLEVLEILTLNELMKWSEAKEKYLELAANYNLQLDTTAYKDIINTKLRKPEKAVKLSYLLPGSGMIYAGAPIRGFTSLALQGGSVALVVHGLREGYFFSSTFTGVALFYLLYNGGAQYASNIAAKRNNDRINAFKLSVKNTLQDNSK
ncbi:MAG: hypothetical protein KDC93_05210 [Cyclobacteriaceae bacterium]|nr:hypothetical protein [Cyclobacteriaceae bacterium]